MSRPIPVIPGYYALVRRVHKGLFRLKPSEEVNALIEFLLSIASFKYNIKVLAFNVISTHWHAVVYDAFARYPEFMQFLNSLIARALNMLHETEDTFWSGMSNSAVLILDAETLLRKIAYVMANPVTHYLTDTAEEWPGFKTSIQDLGSLRPEIDRPKFFFKEDSDLPEHARLRFYMPDMPGLSAVIGERVTARSYRNYMEKAIKKIEEETRQERKEKKIPLVGVKRILAASPFDSIKSKKFKVQKQSLSGKSIRIAPRFATRNPDLMFMAVSWFRQFLEEHFAAVQEWRESIYLKKAPPSFPYGSFKYKRLFGIRCHEVPDNFPIPIYSG